MLQINIAKIKDGLNIKETVTAAVLPEIKAMQDRGELKFNKPLTFELNLKRLDNMLVIEGVLHGEAIMSCGRCLDECAQKLESDFTLKGAPAKAVTLARESEIELKKDDLDDFTYSGNILDLKEILQEQVILALPLAPVCNTGCRGLCPGCGANLNQSACTCAEKHGRSAFDAIKDLL